MMRNIKNNTTGFTIVELLIATLVFSVILFIATYGIINIGRLYRKSINSNQTQQTARSVIDAVSQNIKFNGGVFSENTGAYCLGSNVRLSYAIGQKVSGNAHALVIDKVNCSIDTASKDLNLPLGANEKELLGPNMRLAKFYICYRGVDVANQPDCVGKNNIGEDLYYVLVRVTYGDDDLITNDFQNCKSSAGREFCAVAELGSYVQRVL